MEEAKVLMIMLRSYCRVGVPYGPANVHSGGMLLEFDADVSL